MPSADWRIGISHAKPLFEPADEVLKQVQHDLILEGNKTK
jgi:hypothetical protein